MENFSHRSPFVYIVAGVVVGLAIWYFFMRKSSSSSSYGSGSADGKTYDLIVLRPPEQFTNYPVRNWDDKWKIENGENFSVSFIISSKPEQHTGLIIVLSSDIGRDQQRMAKGLAVVFPQIEDSNVMLTTNNFIEKSIYVGIEKVTAPVKLQVGDVVFIKYQRGVGITAAVNSQVVLEADDVYAGPTLKYIGFGVYSQPDDSLHPTTLRSLTIK